MVLYLVLAIIWIAALTPLILRKVNERRVTTSVDSFRRQLRGLRRAYPRLAASAAHPDMVLSMSQLANRTPRTTMMPPAQLRASHGDPMDTRYDTPAVGGAPVQAGPRTVYRTSSPTSSSQAVRRRQVLCTLGGAVVLTGLLALITGSGAIFDLFLVSLAASAGYIALLIHFHRMAVEREQKVVELYAPPAPSRVGTPITPYVPERRPTALEYDAEDPDAVAYLDDEHDYDDDGYESAAGGR